MSCHVVAPHATTRHGLEECDKSRRGDGIRRYKVKDKTTGRLNEEDRATKLNRGAITGMKDDIEKCVMIF